MKQNEFELNRHVGNERIKRLSTEKYMKMCEMCEPTHWTLLIGRQSKISQGIGKDISLNITQYLEKIY